MKYNASISFFICSEDEDAIERRNKVLDLLESSENVCGIDWYDDGEDWCIDCIIEIETNRKNFVDSVTRGINKFLGKIYETWDYHYINGVDNERYWQP